MCSIGLTTATWIDTKDFGLDRHVWDMKIEWAVEAAKVCNFFFFFLFSTERRLISTMGPLIQSFAGRLDRSVIFRGGNRLHETLDIALPSPHGQSYRGPSMAMGPSSGLCLHLLLRHRHAARILALVPTLGRALARVRRVIQHRVHLHVEP